MTRVGFIMRAHPRDEGACLVSGAVKNPYRLLRSLRDDVEVAGVLVADHRGGFVSHGYPVDGLRLRGLRLYVRVLVWNLITLPRVVRLFARSDIVQCHHPHFGLGAAIVRRFLHRRVMFVVKAHGTTGPERSATKYTGIKQVILNVNAAVHRRHDGWVVRSADRCLVSSDYQLGEMVEIYGVEPSRLRRIYNGFDPQYRSVRDRCGDHAVEAPRFVFVGRVAPKKGYRHLRDLYVALRTEFPRASLTLVLGRRDAIEDPVTHRFITEQLVPLPGCRVLFDLSEGALYETLSESDIGLVPSEGYESIPTVVLEMCGAGLPVFATYRWGIPEVLPDEFGLTGDVGTDAARVSGFIRTRLRSWASAEWAARHEPFGYDRLASSYCEVYDEILDRARA